jgi:isopropylmalate/homocitrate/citramalate synthase
MSLLRLPARSGTSTANILTGPFEARLDPARVLIWDSTLREGEQPPGVVFSADEKYDIALRLDDFGVRWAAVGFPAVSPEEMRACKRIAGAGLRMKLTALCRLVDGDIAAVRDSGVHMASLFIGASDTHLKDKLRMTEAEVMTRTEAAFRKCRDVGLPFTFAVEDGTRAPLDRLVRLFKLGADAGSEVTMLCDTVGILTPTTTYHIVTKLLAALPGKRFGVHFHNDLGLALANTLAALEAGAEVVNTTVNGAGERSGNVCLEELVVVLKVKYGLDLGFKLENVYDLCMTVHRASRTVASDHKPITGTSCFSHEAGIHVAGILSNPETYQPFAPELVGRHHQIVLGKHSGTQSIGFLAQRAGLTLSEEARTLLLLRIKQEAERRHGQVPEEDVLKWIREAGSAEVPATSA